MTAVDRTSPPLPGRSESGPCDESQYPWLRSYPSGVNWDHPLYPQALTDPFDASVARYGDRACTYFLGRTKTYAEIGAAADRIARGLQLRGIGKGSKIGLLLPNTPTYVAFYYGILRTGATIVNYNPLYTVEELEAQVRDSETALMVTLDLKMLFDKVEALIARGSLKSAVICSFAGLLPTHKSLLFRLARARELARPAASAVAERLLPEAVLMDNDGRYDRVAIDPAEDVALLQYTGGTTGTPKGAMLTHANLSINIQQVMRWATNISEGNERIMGILPFFHCFAMTSVLNLGIAMGCEIVLMPRFDLKQALGLIHSKRPTVLAGVPTLFNAMLQEPSLKRYDLSSLKFCISGGAPLPIEIKRGFEAASGCTLVEGYGLTETSPVATCNPVSGPTREGSIGLPVPGTVISVRALDDPAGEVPLGENGEICIAGPQVMKGYWNKPEETRDSFVGEFFRTGDIGHMAPDGFIYIVDRLKDMINVSGFKVYPRRIEEAIYAHPAVAEVTVIGIPDAYRGETPKAFIRLREGARATAEEILAFLAPKLSKIELPSEIEFRDELPKTMIGKLSKKELRSEALATAPAASARAADR